MSINLENEVKRRRTFAIISHPDAGKTTLTEKFLLYGGAIRQAGTVKSRKSERHAISDWMEIEKQRGISVTSSVLQFEYAGQYVNILDTPGHQDFSEDTYRTLMAADNAVMVVDCAKGVEEQTKKLFKVCNLRQIPIFTFINKLDRDGLDPFELLEDIEKNLGIRSYPVNWPIGMGKSFKGVYNRIEDEVILFSDSNHGQNKAKQQKLSLKDESLQEIIGQILYEKLMDDLDLLNGAGDEFEPSEILTGKLTPVYFGSALTNFGVEPFLLSFFNLSTMPSARNSNKGPINPSDETFSGFIFKIQANMNPNHRDRIAFMRICSGKFEKGMQVNHVQGGKKIVLSQPQQFLAQDRIIVEDAYPGDIIGLHDPGIFNIGDTLTNSKLDMKFEGIPVFAPEHFAKVSIKNSLKRKQFIKGIYQLVEEGSLQVFKKPNIGTEELIVGVVGMLQFEVLEYRLKNEYGVDLITQILPYKHIRWIKEGSYNPNSFNLPMDTVFVLDQDDSPVVLFQNEWAIRQITDRNKGIILEEIHLK
jgi:peptide chain release factor 3